MIRHYDLNNEWKYSGTFEDKMTEKVYEEAGMETVRLPHTNVQTPFNHFSSEIYQFVSCYRKHVKAEADWFGKQVLLTFEGAAHIAKVYINGSHACTHLGGYTAFTVDMAPYLKYGEDNVIAVELDSSENCNIPPFGYVIDYLTYGGIYREVYLDIKEAVSIEDVFIKTRDKISNQPDNNINEDNINAEIRITNNKVADIKNTDIIGADNKSTDIKNTDIIGADNKNTDIKNTDIKGADINNADNNGADNKCGEIKGAVIKCGDIKGTDIKCGDINNTDEEKTDRVPVVLYKKEIKLEVKLHGFKSDHFYQLKYTVTDFEHHQIVSDVVTVSGDTLFYRFDVEGIKNWDISEPNLYFIHLELYKEDQGQQLMDEKRIRFGFRTCEFRKDGFYLNDRKVKLVGLNRHQSFPYVGYAMPKRMQQLDAEILKEELQVNVVRTSHYPQSKHFIDRCDELGLLVITEIPGWQQIGDEEWKNVACEHAREMVLQYRNHPSIIMWGVRINESQDDDKFYERTNRIAHQLDSSRQTGGIRNFIKSHLLEDVYTYNDFLHNGSTKGLDCKEDITSDKNAPYMVTEFNGHMFPTKPFDDEEHRLQHALRHARVLNSLFEQEEIAGGTGWCMFDYNTHRDFGSGDMICYHGVLDMFRNPKLAAAVYASQSDASVICEVSSSLDIGEHPAGDIEGIYAFTNADSIRLYKNDTLIKEFTPDDKNYPDLPHPPIWIDDFVGDLLVTQEHYKPKTAKLLKEVLFAVKKYGQNNLPLRYKLKMAYVMLKDHLTMEVGVSLYYKYIGSWGGAATTFHFEAVKEGKVVKVINKKPCNHLKLNAITNTTILKEEATYDVAEVRIIAVDEDNNRLPYYQEPVSLTAWGAVELIGPAVISLKGGAAGAYVKTKGITGAGGLKIHQVDLGETIIDFQVL